MVGTLTDQMEVKQYVPKFDVDFGWIALSNLSGLDCCTLEMMQLLLQYFIIHTKIIIQVAKDNTKCTNMASWFLSSFKIIDYLKHMVYGLVCKNNVYSRTCVTAGTN